MKASIPASIVKAGHPDFALLTSLAKEIVRRAGGQGPLQAGFTAMLREAIDSVIMTPKTGRRAYVELEKTEKTYIGTRVEIELRSLLKLPKGKLDTVILGHDVDIKHTMGNNWMIPTEAVGHPCILVAADETKAKCYLGLVVAHPHYLTMGQNKDSKKTISAQGFENILWIFNAVHYPPNFWRHVPNAVVQSIYQQKTGNGRVVELFKGLQRTIITRDVIEATAMQKDFMRRIRADNKRGTRDILAKQGILLLNGHYDKALIAALGLPQCTKSEFVSHTPKTAAEVQKAASHGHTVVWNPPATP
ncbi:NaeI family type II restriction endonuclease [Palleronia sp. KMU-117]|uniref:NaeI family type II restriction endonuclease n=1 Tax=Palleronia sp. KMU-117 TaxID=3434108 RepID=UPI003D71D7F0